MLVVSAALVLLALAHTSARAHGGPPALLQVVAADAEGPRLVRHTEGFVQRLGARWVYVCPSLFGSTEVPRAIALEDDVAWIASVTGTFTLDAEGRVRAVSGDGPLTQLAIANGAVFGLRFRLQGTAVMRLEAGAMQPVHESDEAWTMLSANGAGLLLGRVEGEALVAQELGTSGELGARWSVEAELANKLVTLRAIEGVPFATTLDPAGFMLYRVRDRGLEPVLEAPGAILGPMRAPDDHLWLSTYDTLWRIEDGALAMHAAAQWITCFDRVADRAFACTQDQVRDFTGPALGAVRMDLHDLERPTASDGDLAGDAACSADWSLFRADLSTIGIELADGAGATDAGVTDAAVDAASSDANPADASAAPVARRHASGCAVARTRSSRDACVFALAFVLVLAAYRARCRRA